MPGEHQRSSRSSVAIDPHVVADRADRSRPEAVTRAARVPIAEVAEDRRTGAEQHRRVVADDAVDQPVARRTTRRGSARLRQQRDATSRSNSAASSAPRSTRPSRRGSRHDLGAGVDQRAQTGRSSASSATATSVGAPASRTRADGGVRASLSTTTRSGCRAAGQSRTVSCGVVGEHRADADDHRVGHVALAVHVAPGGGTGDPLAGAVRRGGPAVERGGVLPGDVRPASAGSRVSQRPRSRRRLVGEHAGLDVDAGRAQLRAAARGDRRAGRRAAKTTRRDAGSDDRVGAGSRSGRCVGTARASRRGSPPRCGVAGGASAHDLGVVAADRLR